MFTIFNSEKLWMGTDLGTLSKIREALAGAGIEYKIKTYNHLGQGFGMSGSRRGHVGSFGNSASQMYHYEVIVSNKDIEKAQYLINQCR